MKKTNNKIITEIVEEIFLDGEIHSIQEINKLSMSRGADLKGKTQPIRNVIYNYKKKHDNFYNVERGEYQLFIPSEFDKKGVELSKTNLPNSFVNTINEVRKYIARIENVSWMQENIYELTNLRLELEQLECLADEIYAIRIKKKPS